jgi:hypothetical protein
MTTTEPTMRGGWTHTAPCRDGQVPEPFTPDALAGVREALRFYDSTSTVPRLLATIDEMVGERATGGGAQ